ncbi:hypothetical protein IJI76_03345 [Candidatus Saccharibacteria bacterium]|nr:hypothetical protein [Candidatus Saccharibacteria bacterium]
MAIVIINDGDKPKDEVFGESPLCEQLLFNREHEQANREKRLDEIIKEARKLVVKYLCAVKTENEDYISDFLDSDLLNLIVRKGMHNSRANSIVDVAGFLLHTISDELNCCSANETVVAE